MSFVKKINLDEKVLKHLYYEKGLSMKQISLELGVGYNLVKRHFREFNIEKRSSSEQGFLTKSVAKNRVNLSCTHCGKNFEIKKSLLGRAKNHFCSISCSSTYYSLLNPLKVKTGEIVQCYICGKEHYKPKHILDKGKNCFCSTNCVAVFFKQTALRGESHPRYSRIKVACSNCGKTLDRIPAAVKNNINHHYCSKECMAEHYVGLVYGENHPSWKGGGDLYYGHDWRRISDKIIERDSFACKRCGIKQKDLPVNWSLQVHHKKRLRDCESLEEANNPENLDTLCNRCHGIVEHHGIDY